MQNGSTNIQLCSMAILIECLVSFKEQERAELQRAADTDAFSPVLWLTGEGGGHPRGLKTRIKDYREDLENPPVAAVALAAVCHPASFSYSNSISLKKYLSQHIP